MNEMPSEINSVSMFLNEGHLTESEKNIFFITACPNSLKKLALHISFTVVCTSAIQILL